MNRKVRSIPSLRRVGLTLTLSLALAVVSLLALHLNAFAGVSSGAGGCGNFIDAVAKVVEGDAIFPMIPARDSGGATITKNITIQGGWSPPPSNCTEANQTLATAADFLAAGFTFTAPTDRSGLFRSNEPVLTVDPSVMTLTLQHLELEQQGNSVGQGGAVAGVINNGADVRLENVVMTSSTTISNGGGLYLEVRGGSNLVISDTQFLNNASPTGGGFEIRVYDNSTVTILNATVMSNSATTGDGGGGKIVIESGTVTIANSNFSSNSAAGSGADLAIEGIGSSASVYLLNNTINDVSRTGNVTVFDKQVFLPTVSKDREQARITNISLSGSTYNVTFETDNFTPSSGTHLHFFFDTVAAADAGVPGAGPWKIHTSSSNPFTGYSTSDKPGAATQMCVLVANSDHSIRPGTGNCYDLP